MRGRSCPRLVSALDWSSKGRGNMRVVSSGNSRHGKAAGGFRGWGSSWWRRGYRLSRGYGAGGNKRGCSGWS